MATFEEKIKRFLYRNLSLDRYLRVVSSLFFGGYRLGLRRFFPTYEYPSFLKNLISPGDVVVDIGANLGYYSWFFARYVGRRGKVYAVEPMQPILPVLRRNVGRSGRVELLPYALGAQEKTIRMVNDTGRIAGFMHTGQNQVRETLSGGAEELSFEAEMKRGSELFDALERLDLIKCDIEGYEAVVLQEMEPVVRKHRPVVLVETGGEARKQLSALFLELGYAGYVLQDKQLRPEETNAGKDIIFIPKQRRERFNRWIKA